MPVPRAPIAPAHHLPYKPAMDITNWLNTTTLLGIDLAHWAMALASALAAELSDVDRTFPLLLLSSFLIRPHMRYRHGAHCFTFNL